MSTLARVVLFAAVLAVAAPAFPCSLVGTPRPDPFPSPFMLVARIELIVRVRAGQYVTPPPGNVRTTGVPDSRVRFEILETLKGQADGTELILPGYLSDRDDYNDGSVPYTFVRENGRSGSCFANTYKQGAQFLLFLGRSQDGWTEHTGALAPVNEQLRDENDPWLLWVRARLGHEAARPTVDQVERPAVEAIYTAVLGGMRDGTVRLSMSIPSSLRLLARTVSPRAADTQALKAAWGDLPRGILAAVAGLDDEPLDERQAASLGLPLLPWKESNRFDDNAIVGFSRVTFAPSRSNALVYVYYSRTWLTGDGFFVRLEQRGRQWVVAKTLSAWSVKPQIPAR
jgi:hypothetical protein